MLSLSTFQNVKKKCSFVQMLRDTNTVSRKKPLKPLKGLKICNGGGRLNMSTLHHK